MNQCVKRCSLEAFSPRAKSRAQRSIADRLASSSGGISILELEGVTRIRVSGGGDDQLYGVTDGAYLVGVVVGDFDVEGVLDLENDVDETGGVDLEVLL